MWGGIPPVENDFEWKSQRKNHLKMGFPLPTFIYPAEKFIWSEDWSRIILFSSDLFLFTFLRSFPFYFLPIFDRESFYSFLPFLSFHFSLSISFFGNSGFNIRYSLSLEEILCPSLQGRGWGFTSQTKVQSSLRLCLNMVFSSRKLDFDIWGKTNFRVEVSLSGWISILFPRGTRNIDDLGTTCKISHGYNLVGTQASSLWHCDTKAWDLHK